MPADAGPLPGDIGGLVNFINTNIDVLPEWAPAERTRSPKVIHEFEVRPSNYDYAPEDELALFIRPPGGTWDHYAWAELSPESLRNLAAALNLYLVKRGRDGAA